MHVIRSLVVIVSIVLVGQTLAVVVEDDAGIVDHPSRKDAFDRDELLDSINRIYYGDHVDAPKYTAEYLYRTEKKETTEVIQGLTVEQLIKLNYVTIQDCSQEALKTRADAYLKTAGYADGLWYAVNAYLLACLQGAAKFCTKHRDEVVGGINDSFFMSELEYAWQTDYYLDYPFNPKFEGVKTWSNFRSTIARLIVDGADKTEAARLAPYRKDRGYAGPWK